MNINKPYIIGETAYNHEGDKDYLLRMIDDVAEAMVNAVKFHLLLSAESYLQKDHPLIDIIKQWMFNKGQWREIIKTSTEKGLDVVALCDDVESLEFINEEFQNITAIELHASGLNDYYLLKEAAKFKGTIILGVGGSSIDEIQYAVDFLKNYDKHQILLMYGFQSFPTNYADINLRKMKKLKDMFDLPVGYADHTSYNDPMNEWISSSACAMGFNVLEKHYTPDPGVERIDYHAAVGKEKLLRIRDLMEISLKVRGDGELSMSDPELNYGNTGPMKKAIVARHTIQKGEKLSIENLAFKRTEGSSTIKQNMFPALIGLKTARTIEVDEIIDYSKIEYEFKKRSLKEFTNKKGD